MFDDPILVIVVLLGGVVGLFVCFLVFDGLDSVLGSPVRKTGVVAEKHYKAESDSVGTGVGMAGGNMAVVTTSSHDDEDYILFVDVKEMDAYEKVSVSARDYKNAKSGDKIMLIYSKGKWTRRLHGPKEYEL